MGTRISLFLATNLAIVLVLGITAQILGLDDWLAQHGMPGQLYGFINHILDIWFWGFVHIFGHFKMDGKT